MEFGQKLNAGQGGDGLTKRSQHSDKILVNSDVTPMAEETPHGHSNNILSIYIYKYLIPQVRCPLSPLGTNVTTTVLIE